MSQTSTALEQPPERTVIELLEKALTREGQWTAAPNRAVRSELTQGGKFITSLADHSMIR